MVGTNLDQGRNIESNNTHYTVVQVQGSDIFVNKKYRFSYWNTHNIPQFTFHNSNTARMEIIWRTRTRSEEKRFLSNWIRMRKKQISEQKYHYTRLRLQFRYRKFIHSWMDKLPKQHRCWSTRLVLDRFLQKRLTSDNSVTRFKNSDLSWVVVITTQHI